MSVRLALKIDDWSSHVPTCRKQVRGFTRLIGNIAGWKSWHGLALLIFHRCRANAFFREGSSSGWKLKQNKKNNSRDSGETKEPIQGGKKKSRYALFGEVILHRAALTNAHLYTHAHICAEARGENISGLL